MDSTNKPSVEQNQHTSTFRPTTPNNPMQNTTEKTSQSESTNDLFFYKNWARFARIMQIQNGQDSENWANHFLQHLIPFVGGFQATLYLKNISDEDEGQTTSYRLIGGYALDTSQAKEVVKLGEETIGLVAKSKQTSHVITPDNTPIFKTPNTTIPIPVHSILTLPIIYQEEVYGILEILFHQSIASQFLDFLDKINNSIGANLGLLLKDETIRLQNDYLNHQLRQTRNHLIISEEFRKLHTNLTESIEYAQNIQNAILPSNSSFEKLFQEYFIIYKPKDIVSGDFYWMMQTTNHDKTQKKLSKTTFLAAVDCTGHGVPGAFMSMIGTMLLNEIVTKKGIDSPARILKMMHIGVRAALKQSEGQNKDGMDICFCKIIPQENNQYEVTFAGAKRPLYYSQNNELFKKRGARRSIGGDNQVKGAPFENHTMQLLAGDKLFLSTDGLKDVASPKRRNFGQQRLELLLQQGLEGSMIEHRQLLLSRLAQHQQDAQQRDDITFIGVKL